MDGPSNFRDACRRIHLRTAKIIISDTLQGLPVKLDPTLPVNEIRLVNPDGSFIPLKLEPRV